MEVDEDEAVEKGAGEEVVVGRRRWLIRGGETFVGSWKQ